jgi:hypothetical protein
MYLFDDFNSGSVPDTGKWDVTGEVSLTSQHIEIGIGGSGWNSDGIAAKTVAPRIADDTVVLDIKGSSTFSIGLMDGVSLVEYSNPGLIFVFNNSDHKINYILDSGIYTYTGFDWVANTDYTLTFKFRSGGGWTVSIDGGIYTDEVILDTASGGGTEYNLQCQQLFGYTTIDNVYLSGSGGGGIPILRRRIEGH